MSASILHLMPAVNRGGPTRALVASLKALAEHADEAPAPRVASLRPADPSMLGVLADQGIPVLDSPGPEELGEAIADADLVQLSFWNSPEAYEVLRGELPPMRLVIWFVIGGGVAPQVIVPELLEIADLPLAAGPTVVGARGDGGLDAILPVLDRSRSRPRDSVAHDGFVVGYVGTVDPVKMHPDFVALSSAVTTPGARFPVYGSGDGFAAIAAEAERRGTRERFELGGFVDDVGAVLAGFDVFGYPLCRENYSTTDQVLMEAMSAGVTPVVLPYGGAGGIVTDGVSGIVARDEGAYTAALDRLGADPALRARLGVGAASAAEELWSPRAGAGRWMDAYASLLEAPKRARGWPGGPAPSGAVALLDSLGELAGPLRRSHSAEGAGAHEADAAVAALQPTVARGDGGILDYRRRYPDDPHLRLWSGLVLGEMGRPALAAGELAAAVRAGLPAERAQPRIAELAMSAAPAGAAG